MVNCPANTRLFFKISQSKEKIEVQSSERYRYEDQNESDSEETELREELISSIRNELNVPHPIFYDTYNLCDLYRQQ
jgi:hypothetical protein